MRHLKAVELGCHRLRGRFERRLRRRDLVVGEVSEGAVEAPSDVIWEVTRG